MNDDEFLTAMAKKLAELRSKAQLNQEELAEAAGVSRNTISRYEVGGPSKLDELSLIAKALELDLFRVFATMFPDRREFPADVERAVLTLLALSPADRKELAGIIQGFALARGLGPMQIALANDTPH